MPGQHKGARKSKLVREMYARDPNVSLGVVAVVIHFKRIGDVRRLYRKLGLRPPDETPPVDRAPSNAMVRKHAPQSLSAPVSSIGSRATVTERPTREISRSLEDAAGAAPFTEVLRKTGVRAVADLNESILVGETVRKLWREAAQSEFSNPLSFFDAAAKFYINEHGRYTERLGQLYLLQQRVEELEREVEPLERRREEWADVLGLATVLHMAGIPFTADGLRALLQLSREDMAAPPPEEGMHGVPLETEEAPTQRKSETLIELPDKLIEQLRGAGWIVGGRLEVPPGFFRSTKAS